MSILESLIDKKEYISKIRFLMDTQDYGIIYNNYPIIIEKNPDDLYSRLILALPWIIKIYKLYLMDEETKNINEENLKRMRIVHSKLKGTAFKSTVPFNST